MDLSTTKYEAVIGLEVHAQLSTKTKAFSSVAYTYGARPNSQVTPLCLGHPGTLPAVNKLLVYYTIKMGYAVHCTIARECYFARKNYFYPDLPKGYQISQFDTPLCSDGYVMINDGNDGLVKIGIKRIHMEEDAGKSIHDQDPKESLIDLNRAGACLIEIVSEPDICTPKQAYNYLTTIKQLVQYLDICDGNMEKGSLRCDANISVRKKNEVKLGTRTEIKNLNSIRNVERALTYEIERQIIQIEKGHKIEQQTLLWDAAGQHTTPMRSKEESLDYRYFPEPDIPPLVIDEDILCEIQKNQVELPQERKKRFMEQYKLNDYVAQLLTSDRYIADYYEETMVEDVEPLATANLIQTHVLKVLNDKKITIREFSISPLRLSKLVKLRMEGSINSSAQSAIFDAMLNENIDAIDLAKKMNLMQISDIDVLSSVVEKILNRETEKVAQYRDGKVQLFNYFLGQVMRETKGRANPAIINGILKQKLENE